MSQSQQSAAAHGHDEHDEGDGAVHAHVMPTIFYIGIFATLVVLTLLTVGISYVHLGAANLAVAVIIASIKAALVVLFFMHLRWDNKFNALIFICSLGFIGIFFAYTFSDTGWRDKQYNDSQGAHFSAADGKPAPGGMPPRDEAYEKAHEHNKAGADKNGASAGMGAAGAAAAPSMPTAPPAPSSAPSSSAAAAPASAAASGASAPAASGSAAPAPSGSAAPAHSAAHH